jgi:GDPmannose 4,6-dehydratase
LNNHKLQRSIQDEPDDYVIATGETDSVREFCEETFNNLGVSISWKGEESMKKL